MEENDCRENSDSLFQDGFEERPESYGKVLSATGFGYRAKHTGLVEDPDVDRQSSP
jgi:hypothetical protein